MANPNCWTRVRPLAFGLVLSAVSICSPPTAFGSSSLADATLENVVKGVTVHLRIVDPAGLPVGNVRVGENVYKSTDRGWSFKRADGVTADDGTMFLFYDEPRMIPRLLYALSDDEQLVGYLEIDPNNLGPPQEIQLFPACRVHGRVTSAELVGLGRKIASCGVQLCTDHGFAVVGNQSSSDEYSLLVPPGNYKIVTRTRDAYYEIADVVVATGSNELELEPVDLAAHRIAMLEGKPAPELERLDEWMNGDPVRLADLKGKVALMAFWVNRQGRPHWGMQKLSQLHESLSDVGLEIVAIHNNSVSTIEELDKNLGQTFPFRIAIDGGETTKIEGTSLESPGENFATYGIYGRYPTCVLIDPDGTVLGEIQLLDDQKWLKKRICRLLGVEVPKDPEPPILALIDTTELFLAALVFTLGVVLVWIGSRDREPRDARSLSDAA